MRVKLTTGRVGNGFSQDPGQVIEVSDAEARRLLASGQAEPANAEPAKKSDQPRRK